MVHITIAYDLNAYFCPEFNEHYVGGALHSK